LQRLYKKRAQDREKAKEHAYEVRQKQLVEQQEKFEKKKESDAINEQKVIMRRQQ